MSVYDAAIVGGGPSGLYAARLLAEHGLSVTVLERKEEIGADVICTGIVGREIFQEFSLPADSILSDLQTIKLAMSSGRDLTYRHPVPFAVIVDRKKFDRGMTLAAQRAGVEIELGCRVSGLCPERGFVRVEAMDPAGRTRKISARMAVLATGNNYRLHRKAGLGYPRDFLLGVQAELTASGGGSQPCLSEKISPPVDSPGPFLLERKTRSGSSRSMNRGLASRALSGESTRSTSAKSCLNRLK